MQLPLAESPSEDDFYDLEEDFSDNEELEHPKVQQITSITTTTIMEDFSEHMKSLNITPVQSVVVIDEETPKVAFIQQSMEILKEHQEIQDQSSLSSSLTHSSSSPVESTREDEDQQLEDNKPQPVLEALPRSRFQRLTVVDSGEDVQLSIDVQPSPSASQRQSYSALIDEYIIQTSSSIPNYVETSTSTSPHVISYTSTKQYVAPANTSFGYMEEGSSPVTYVTHSGASSPYIVESKSNGESYVQPRSSDKTSYCFAY